MSVMIGAVAVRYCGQVRFIMTPTELRITAPDRERRWVWSGPQTQQEATVLALRLCRTLVSFGWPLDRVVLDGNRKEVASWLDR